MWDLEGRELSVLKWRCHPVRLAALEDGRVLLRSFFDDTLRVSDLSNSEPLILEEGIVQEAKQHGDLWDSYNSNSLILDGRKVGIRAGAVMAGGHLASGNHDGQLCAWDPNRDKATLALDVDYYCFVR